MKIIEASLAGGKTYRIGRLIPRIIGNGGSVWALANTHKACEEIREETENAIDESGDFGGTILYLKGKSRRHVCHEDYVNEKGMATRSCTNCPHNLLRKKEGDYMYSEEIEFVEKNLEVEGELLDPKSIKKWASENDLDKCARGILLYVFERYDVKGAIFPYQYLIHLYSRRVLPPYGEEEVEMPDKVLGDEGDSLIEVLQSGFVKNLKLASTRTSKKGPNRHQCTQRCSDCRFDYAVNNQHDNQDPVEDYARQIDIMKEGVDFLENEETFQDEMVDLDVVRENIRKVEGIYRDRKENETPKDWLQNRLEELVDDEDWEIFLARATVFTNVFGEEEVKEEKYPLIDFDDPLGDQYTEEDLTVNTMFAPEEPERPRSVENMLQSDQKLVFWNIRRFIEFTSKIGRSESPAVVLFLEQSEPENIGYCRLVLSHLDQKNYKGVLDLLRESETVLFSGTFLQEGATRDVLMAEDEDLQYEEISCPAPENIHILHHNYAQGKNLLGKSRRDNPKIPKKFDYKHLGIMLDILSEKLSDINVLIFCTNKEEAAELAENLRRHQREYEVDRVRGNSLNQLIEDSEVLGAKKKKRVIVTYLRDVNTRGRNIPKVDLLIVYGSGRPSFEQFYAFTAGLKKAGFDRRVRTVDDLIDYNRVRHINQANLRHHRNSEKQRVSLLINDLHYRNIPEYLRNRVTLTQELFEGREAKGDLARYQAERIAEEIVDILISEKQLSKNAEKWLETARRGEKRLGMAGEIVGKAAEGNPVHRTDFDFRAGDVSEILSELSSIGVLREAKKDRKKVYERGVLFEKFRKWLS